MTIVNTTSPNHFSTAANNIAHYFNDIIYSLGEGTNGEVLSISANITLGGANTTQIYVTGIFTSAGNTTCNSVALWDGNEWSPLGEGIHILMEYDDYPILQIEIWGAYLFVGGAFDKAGSENVNNIAKWDTNNQVWLSVGDEKRFNQLIMAPFAINNTGGELLVVARSYDEFHIDNLIVSGKLFIFYTLRVLLYVY